MRDRLGMLCATGAVACLASLTAQWSRELPVQRSPWERELFGDLTVPAASQSTRSPIADAAPPLERSVRPPSLQEPILIFEEPLLVEVPPAETTRPMEVDLDPRSADALFQLIQPVRHQESDVTPTVWLSGGIELLDDNSTPTSQPGTRYFPEAHRDQARRQDLAR